MFKRTNTKIQNHGPFSSISLIVVLIVFAGLGSYLIINSFATTASGQANLWIDAVSGTTHSCARVGTPGLTGEDYATASNPSNHRVCSSIQAAISACTPGDTIRMKAGNYTSEPAITAIKDSPGCTVIGGDGGTTTLNSISPKGAWFEIQNVNVTGSVSFEDVGGGLPHHVTFRNVNAGQPSFWDGGDTIKWIGGKIGPYSLQPASYNGCMNLEGIPTNYGSGLRGDPLTNVVLDGLDISGCTRSAARAQAGDHTEVIRLNEGIDGLTIKNSTFDKEDVNSACIFYGSTGAGPAAEKNITLENNFFGSGCNKAFDGNLTAAVGGNNCIGYTFSFNTSTSDSPGDFRGGKTVDCNGTNIVVKGNLLVSSARVCWSGATYDHNVWMNAASVNCTDAQGNTTDKTITKAQAAFTGTDFHIGSSSLAKDIPGLINCPATDHDGGTRPSGSACDAGAHEFGSVPSGGGGSAALWVDADGGACTRTVSYATSTACTWAAAYSAANDGEEINVKGGTYGNVSMPTNDGTGMTFKAVPNESVVLTGLDWRASPTGLSKDNHGPDNVTVVGPMKIGPTSIDGVTNTTFDNIDFDGGGGTSRAVQGDMPNTVPASGANLTIKNSKLHNTVEANSMVYFSGAKLVFDNNEFYDALINPGSSTHTECLYLWATSNITISRSHFWDCDAEAVFITGSATWPNATVENNVFEIVAGSAANASSGLAFRNGGAPSPYPTNMLLRFNTFMSGVQVPDSTSGATGNVYGNYFRLTPPTGWGSIVYGCNVTSSGPSSGCNNTNAAAFTPSLIYAGFTNPITTQGNGTSSNKAPKGDYTLKSTSPFIDLMSSSSAYPITDLLGKDRYKGTAPDLGAYEYQSSTTPTPKPGDTNGDNLVNIVDLSTVLSKWNTNFTSADFNKDGTVNVFDLSILLSNYGK